ncbi:helix-turn-helix domain-containing protein [Dysgonomonas macrotermitis]|uniref:Helix-turn-helix n=1 Tax=Dysgonomonas macrotermitis TaxID=1346286 RepID=A0A1M5AHK9_9BACT|nr:helix-turn-helix transcriptional regulator [Dysgonomonas macrotermitis]SHF29703.1 Helix-turn-helix [Dysgonomonas macrotermitis]
MKDRIKLIMDSENMNPARFADTLEIGRAVVSHILNGRNNPSLDVITRILIKMPNINSEWLLTGIGPMYKDADMPEINKEEHKRTISSPSLPDLFAVLPNEGSVNTTNGSDKNKYQKEKELVEPENILKEVVNERIIYKEAKEKKIKQIIIYYTDSTFETFDSH